MGTSRVRSLARKQARELRAGSARQHPVQQNQVRQFRAHQRRRLLGIGRAQHLVAGEREIDGNQFLDRGFVFDDEDGAGHPGTLRKMIALVDDG